MESPKTGFDEGLFIQIARNLLTHHSYVLRASPTQVVPAGVLATVGLPVMVPISLSFHVFGIGLLQARVVMVIYILLMVTTLYLFAYSVWGFRAAMWGTLLVATHAPVYGNGKNVLGEVPGLFFFFLFLYFLFCLERKERPARAEWMGVGLAAGMFVATKPTFILILPVVFGAFVLLRKRMRMDWKNILLAIVALVIPIGANFLLQFGCSFSAIMNGFRSYSNLPGLQQYTGLTLPALIQRNAWVFVRQATPAYLFATFCAWAAYVFVRCRRKRPIPLHECIAFVYVVLSIAYFLKTPGFFRYLFVAQAITLPYFAVSCRAVAASFKRSWIKARITQSLLAALFVVMVLFQTYQVLFSSWVAGYYQSTRSKELAEYFQQLDPSTQVFFYHTLEAVTFYKGERYFQYFQLLLYNDAFGKDRLASLEEGVPAVVLMAGDLDAGTQQLLGKYKKDRVINGGQYIVYARK